MDSSAEQPETAPEQSEQSASNTPLVLPPLGGLGRAVSYKNGSDERLIMRAVREQWPIPDERRAWCVQRLLEGAENAPEWRERIAAIRTLMGMNGQNMEARGEKSTPSTVHVTIAEQVVQIGRQLAGEVPHPEQADRGNS